jgi:uncharacterized protein
MGDPRRFRRVPRASVAGFEVQVATTCISRLLGLAWLAREDAGPGLLIPRCRSVHTSGMRFPIDVLFLGSAGEVIERIEAVPPGRLLRNRKAVAVLEVPS